jgi:hypothetical protein
MQEITRIVFPLGNDPGLIAYERPPWRTSSSSLHSMLAVSANVLLKPSVLSGPFRTSACPGLRPSLILLTLERCAWAKGSARMLSHPGGPVRRETLRVLHSAGRPDGPYVAMLATVALRTSMGSRRRSAPGI